MDINNLSLVKGKEAKKTAKRIKNNLTFSKGKFTISSNMMNEFDLNSNSLAQFNDEENKIVYLGLVDQDKGSILNKLKKDAKQKTKSFKNDVLKNSLAIDNEEKVLYELVAVKEKVEILGLDVKVLFELKKVN